MEGPEEDKGRDEEREQQMLQLDSTAATVGVTHGKSPSNQIQTSASTHEKMEAPSSTPTAKATEEKVCYNNTVFGTGWDSIQSLW